MFCANASCCATAAWAAACRRCARRRARLLGPRELHRGAEPVAPRPGARASIAATSPPAPTWWRPTASAARRSRSANSTSPTTPSRSTAAPANWRARRRRVRRRPAPLGARQRRAGHQAAAPRQYRLRALEEALAEQCRGLIAGGVDAILIETCQDPLQIKAAVNGAKRARRRRRHATRRSSCRSRSKPPARCWSAPTSPPPPPWCTRWTCR